MGQLRNRNGEKGFTMVELIAVLIVIGILAAYAVPKFMNLTEDAKTSAARSALVAGVSMAQHEVAGYMMRNAGAIPTAADLTGLTALHDLGDFKVGFAASGDVITVYACSDDETTACDNTTVYQGRDASGNTAPVQKTLSIRELAGYDAL